MSLSINGSALFRCIVPGADTATFLLSFGVMQEPPETVVTIDESLCSVTTTGDEVLVEFPTYEIPDSESLTYALMVNAYDPNGVIISTNAMNVINIVPAD